MLFLNVSKQYFVYAWSRICHYQNCTVHRGKHLGVTRIRRYLSPQFMMPQCDEILGLIFRGSWITSAAIKIVLFSNCCAIEVKHRLTIYSSPPTCCRYHELPVRVGQLVHACAHLCPLYSQRLSQQCCWLSSLSCGHYFSELRKEILSIKIHEVMLLRYRDIHSTKKSYRSRKLWEKI